MKSLLGLTLILASVADAFPSTENTDSSSSSSSGRHQQRVLQSPETEFTLYLLDIEYEANSDTTGGAGVNEDDDGCWVVEITDPAVLSTQMMSECIEGISKAVIDATGSVSGGAVLKGNGILLEQHTSDAPVKLIVTENTAFEIQALEETDRRHYKSRRRHRRQRKLQEQERNPQRRDARTPTTNTTDPTGIFDANVDFDDHHHQYSRLLAGPSSIDTLDVLVVRVTSQVGNNSPIEVDANAAQLKDDIFDDDVCLKSQYAACSHGQLNINPAGPESDTFGVVEVTINIAPSYLADQNGKKQTNNGALRTAAVNKAKELYGDRYDLVMLCLPPGSGNWVRFFLVCVCVSRMRISAFRSRDSFIREQPNNNSTIWTLTQFSTPSSYLVFPLIAIAAFLICLSNTLTPALRSLYL